MNESLESLRLLGDLLEESRSPGAGAPADAPGRPVPLGDPAAPVIPLPGAAAGDAIEATLAARRSERDYAPTPLDVQQVSTVLAGAREADARAWGEEREAGVGVELLLVAWRVEGLAPALYVHRPEQDALAFVGPAPTGEPAADLLLQREYAAAPALLIVMGDLAAALHRHGSHGYRLMLLRAAGAAHAAWLAAVSLGLRGSVFAGLLPDAVHELTGSNGYDRTQLFGFAFGPPLGIDAGG